jgi:DNA-binding transcriptional ArsR family regulator
MNAAPFDVTLECLKALAHESRLRLLGLLAAGERSVLELARLLDLSEPTISHHLAILRAVDLVGMTPEGTIHRYRLNRPTLDRLNQALLSPEHLAALTDAAGGAAWEQKILRTFLDGERLTAIPAQRKKRQVILRWLAERFEPGVSYPEAAVNALIRPHHDDTATLRRELIASQLLQRENGLYWRTPAEGEL